MSECEDEGGDSLVLFVSGEQAGGRLDKVLAELAPTLSRARLQALIADGRVTRDGVAVGSASDKAVEGAYVVDVPPPAPADPEPEDLPLVVLFEDADLIVLDKAAGMAVHPAPGSERGTLVNALLFHAAGRLSGIGGVARPGIVHRLDKDTSGVMVVAKTDAAHAGLARLFAERDLERSYTAFSRGAPRPPAGLVDAPIARSTHDRKKMAVARTGGRRAVTHYRTEAAYGPAERPTAARLTCRLETGRTHQIRVHMAHAGAPLLGDPVYGSGAPAAPVRAAMQAAGLARQALHATTLGFMHPTTGERLRFVADLPDDLQRLREELEAL